VTLTRLIPGVAVIVVVVVLAILPGGRRASVSFYETAAQVFPVLLVGLAVEDQLRLFSGRLAPEFRWQIIIAIAIGEFVSVLAISGVVSSTDLNKDPLVGPSRKLSDLMSWLTVAGLGVSFLILFIVALER
jgi:hypothetical protein